MPYREMKHNDMLLIIDDVGRAPGPAGEDFFNIRLRVANPVGPAGSLRRGPFIALRDQTGRLYEPAGGSEVATPIRPGDTAHGSIDFEIDVSSEDIQMVIAPGADNEVSIDLPDIPRGSR